MKHRTLRLTATRISRKFNRSKTCLPPCISNQRVNSQWCALLSGYLMPTARHTLYTTRPFRKISMSPEIWTHAESFYRRDMSSPNLRIRLVAPYPSSGVFDISGFPGSSGLLSAITEAKAPFPPPQRLLCANVDVDNHTICEKAGTLFCAKCSLVSYCSKVCIRNMVNSD